MPRPSRRDVLTSCCVLSLAVSGCIASSDGDTDESSSNDSPAANRTSGRVDEAEEDEASKEDDRDPLAAVDGIVWRNADDSILAALGNDAVFVLGNKNIGGENTEAAIAALDGATGDQLWSYGKARLAPLVGPTVADGIYYAVGSDHYGPEGDSLHALAFDGTERWTVDVGSYTAPFVADGTVFTVSGQEEVRAFDSADGTRKWQRQFEDLTGGSSGWPAVAGLTNGTLVVRFHNGTLGGLDPETGTERWRFSAGEDRLDGVDDVRFDDGVYFSTSRETGCLSAGDEQWRVAHDRIDILGPVDDVLVLPTETGVSARRTTDGREAWNVTTDDPIVDVQGESIYVCDEEISALEGDGSERWTRSLDGDGYRVGASDETVYVSTEDRLHRITTAGAHRSTPFEPQIHTLLVGERAYIQTEEALVAIEL